MATRLMSGSGPSCSGPSGTGKPRESPIWDFFIYSDTVKRSTCQVPLSDDKLCGRTFSGRFTSNLKHHLRSCHKEQFAEIEKKDEARKEVKEERKRMEVGPVKQATIAQLSFAQKDDV